MVERQREEHVTKDMLLAEVVEKHPKAAFVFLQYGLHCVGCHVSSYETIEQGAMGHGMPPETIQEMIADVNLFIEEEMGRPASPRQESESGNDPAPEASKE